MIIEIMSKFIFCIVYVFFCTGIVLLSRNSNLLIPLKKMP